MKKYVKPELFYERFELSQHIADCAWELNSANENLCEATLDEKILPDAGLYLFSLEGMCNVQPEDIEGDFGYCYMTGGEGMNVFKS